MSITHPFALHGRVGNVASPDELPQDDGIPQDDRIPQDDGIPQDAVSYAVRPMRPPLTVMLSPTEMLDMSEALQGLA